MPPTSNISWNRNRPGPVAVEIWFRHVLSAAMILTLASVGNCQDLKTRIKPLLASSCSGCHDGSADIMNLQQVGTDLSDPVTFKIWEQIFDRVDRGEMPPESEPRPKSDLLEHSLKQIKTSLLEEESRFREANGRVILRRLTRTEYQHTINDLLSTNTPVASIIPGENVSSGFDTVFSSQGFSPLHAQSYLEAADRALDAAIRLEPKPESRKQRVEYVDNRYVKKHLKDDKRKIMKKLDESLVIFANASYLLKMDVRIATTGWYKIRAKAKAYQSQRPVILTLNAGDYRRGFEELLGFFDLQPEKSKVVEVMAYLESNQYIFPGIEDAYASDGSNVWGVGADDYNGSGIELEWVELEGPLVKQWPPFSTSNLLKGIEISELKKKRWNPRQMRHRQFEIIKGDDPKSQLEGVVGWLAPRAFRRPLMDNEGTPFVNLGLAALENGRTYDEALRVTLRAVLASPNFLFMTSDPGPLDDFSLAERLSYFLWRSMPDRELFMSAAEKKLTDPSGKFLRAEIERMLKDPKFDRFVKDFVSQWLQLKNIKATSPDKNLYPEFDELLEKSMVMETEAFFKYLIENDLSVSNLIDSEFTFLNRRLAEHYQIDGVKGQAMQKTPLPKNSPRGGLLGQASILKVTANGTTTSPVLRGSWVLTHLLGTPPSPPPPSVGSIEPDTRGATTIRELLDKHRDDATCSSCHQVIDPPGFALECFDVIGGYRTKFRSREQGERPTNRLKGQGIWQYKIGLPVDATGRLADGSTFDGIQQYRQLLLKRQEQVARNLIKQLLIFSTGAEISFGDREEVERILKVCRESDDGLQTMIREIILSKIFLEK